MKTVSRNKAREMPRFPKREPRPIPACEACGAFQPDCLVPDGDGAMAMCWLCAHAHVDHGCTVGLECVTHECECAPWNIYPAKVIKERRKEFYLHDRHSAPDPTADVDWPGNLGFCLNAAAVLARRNKI